MDRHFFLLIRISRIKLGILIGVNTRVQSDILTCLIQIGSHESLAKHFPPDRYGWGGGLENGMQYTIPNNDRNA